ncbi:sensor histidine kinase [Ornithinibacillus salinisoli]|uniref:histidine kinase n=1 Tax=Ornithinibacillus salinisoli TaxID=1848459 RepID=A0ABW4VYH9_9BACI
MKWKITTQFLAYLLLSLLLSFIVFLIINISLVRGNFIDQDLILPYQNPSHYTLDFADDIQVEKGEVSISELKLAELEESDIWIQVLDENGSEIYSAFKPISAPSHYTPANLIHYHKFTGALANSTIFVGMLEKDHRDLSYIMGFPEEVIGKANFYFRGETLIRDSIQIISMVVIVVTFIALLFGYFFSKRLAKPLVQITDGIQNLAKGNFSNVYHPKGIYKSVFQNLNVLASTLKSNEMERGKMEKTREEWVTNITHDIKTPLASIKGYSELLQDYDLDESEKKRYVDIILNKSDYIEHLIEDLNLTYKLKSTSFPLQKEEEDLIEIVRDSVIQILNHPLYEETNLDFSTEIEMYRFKVDRTLMQRALMNLIYNAIVHNPPDTNIQIAIENQRDHIHIIITDNGNGIAEEEIKNLFTRYYRGTNTGEKHKGSGLGLAIAKQIVEAHGGEILVESKLGEGTRIRISF